MLFGDSNATLGVTLQNALRQAKAIVKKGVFGRHDLVGRIYHSLLADQKFLATYYTSVPGATCSQPWLLMPPAGQRSTGRQNQSPLASALQTRPAAPALCWRLVWGRFVAPMPPPAGARPRQWTLLL